MPSRPKGTANRRRRPQRPAWPAGARPEAVMASVSGKSPEGTPSEAENAAPFPRISPALTGSFPSSGHSRISVSSPESAYSSTSSSRFVSFVPRFPA